MITHVVVTLSENSGLPEARIPNEHIWGLVEHLSFHRVRVSYNYDSEQFLVCFHQSDVAEAQALLDEWAKATEMSGTAAA